MTEEEKTFPIRIGKLLKSIIDQQMKQIKDVTYNCVDPSPAEAGEIIAKKFLNKV